MEIFKLIALSIILSIFIGIIFGKIVGSYMKNKKSGKKSVLSGKESIICLILAVSGCICILCGVLLVPRFSAPAENPTLPEVTPNMDINASQGGEVYSSPRITGGGIVVGKLGLLHL